MIPVARTRKTFVVTILAGLAACLVSCNDVANSPNSSPDTGNLQDDLSNLVDRSEARMSVSGDTLRIFDTMAYYPSVGCIRSGSSGAESLVTGVDSIRMPGQDYQWSIQGDTLKLSQPDTIFSSGGFIPFVDQLQLIRLTGTGLYGRYRSARVVRIPLADVPANSPDTIFFTRPQEVSNSRLTTIVELVGRGLVKYEARLNISWADYTIFNMKDAYDDELQLDYAKIDDRTFLITGRITKEVVRIRLLRVEPGAVLDGDIEFYSDNSSHPAAVKYLRPTSCPNGPSWLSGFYDSNKATN